MDLQEQLLAVLTAYGLPVLFGVILAASVGAPLPATLLLIAAGAFAADGTFNSWWVILVATTAAVLGDHLGYGIGRWGGRRLVLRMSQWTGGEARLHKAESMALRWGTLGVFFSRWLVSPAGPAINLTSGIASYSPSRFLLADLSGELVWVLLYTTIGRVFGNQVDGVSGLLGNLAWWICGVLALVILARKLVQRASNERAERGPQPVLAVQRMRLDVQRPYAESRPRFGAAPVMRGVSFSAAPPAWRREI